MRGGGVRLEVMLAVLLSRLPPSQAGCEERAGWLSCNDTTLSCLSPAQICDGQPDCEDGGDEAGEVCGRLRCEEGVRCEDGSACIRVPHQVVCRGQERGGSSVCRDRSEQAHCLHSVYSGCLESSALGLTITHCDRCLCQLEGPGGLYRSRHLTANICLGPGSPRLCDGVEDCLGGQDEDPGLCAAILSDQTESENPGLPATVKTMTIIFVTIFLICLSFCLIIIFIMLKLCCQKSEDRQAKSMPELGWTTRVSSNVYVLEGRREKQKRSLRTTNIIKELGTGYFSKVFLSEDKYHGFVAIKTTQPSNSEMAQKSILNEISILKELWKHSNVIQMLDSNVEERFLVLEYCLHGNCKDYIGRNKNLFVNQIDPQTKEMKIDEDEDFPFINSDLLDTKTLVKWSVDISRGMSYLGKMKIVHRDLALRNLLLSASRTVKISDLGLAVSSQTGQYWREGERPEPFRHSARESLASGLYSPQSDVWAYGVTLWEMFSLAADPHSEITSPAELLSKLERGERLPVCPLAPQSLHSIMESCWAEQPALRPSFMELTNLIKPLLQLQSPPPHYSVPRSTPVVKSRSFYWTNYKVMQGQPSLCSEAGIVFSSDQTGGSKHGLVG